jgi:hypothetical protein
MLVRTSVLHVFDDSYRNFDETSPVMTANKQAMEGEVRTIPESEKALNRRVAIEVFHFCFEWKFHVGSQVRMVGSQAEHGHTLLLQKYGWKKRLGNVCSGLMKRERVVIEASTARHAYPYP